MLIGLLCFSFIYISSYFNNTNKFFENTHKDYDNLNYSIIVLKNSDYKKISDFQVKHFPNIRQEYVNASKYQKYKFMANSIDSNLHSIRFYKDYIHS